MCTTGREGERQTFLFERIVTLDYCALYKYSYLLSFSNINCVSKKPANILAVSRASKHIFDRVLSRHKANMETQKSRVGRLLSRYAIHEKELFKRFRLDTRKFVFSNRVVHNWNSLSAQCVNSCTINTFKEHVSV